MSFIPLASLNGLNLHQNPWNCTCLIKPFVKVTPLYRCVTKLSIFQWLERESIPQSISPVCSGIVLILCDEMSVTMIPDIILPALSSHLHSLSLEYCNDITPPLLQSQDCSGTGPGPRWISWTSLVRPSSNINIQTRSKLSSLRGIFRVNKHRLEIRKLLFASEETISV